jgi:hypothetical protein
VSHADSDCNTNANRDCYRDCIPYGHNYRYPDDYTYGNTHW